MRVVKVFRLEGKKLVEEPQQKSPAGRKKR